MLDIRSKQVFLIAAIGSSVFIQGCTGTLSINAGAGDEAEITESPVEINNTDNSDSFSTKSYKQSKKTYTFSDPVKLEEILELESSGAEDSQNSEGESIISNLRIRSLKQAGYSLGVQSGMAWRMTVLNKYLDQNSTRLDRIFDFSRFLMDGKVLYPVILESKRMYHHESDIKARTVSVSYVLSKNAKVVPSAPSWREYLSRNAQRPQIPDRRLFPSTAFEKKVWIEVIKKGWIDGVEQANDIFTIDQRKLYRDYSGMQRFRMLVQQNLISMPELAIGNFGVIKDGKTLNVNDVIYEITMGADFNNEKNWKPIFKP
ncbi:MAG: type IV secretion system DotC family protein [gamma proteobacterium symbiont of Bathyaustriella thionipta]|nr:type IV secretion system DotC family protein [gamma proteobacterium symbiont of Bathyaustriella thionipta]MCU7954647.1 type IV secretion system DotC family protein [gamma proteobacterium symbiont of Bathyaustriella thionipta]MCU7957441.1 type IV secretion system DotC family protein [gamma proteobacterium symbiont of Bathyaustriella thionipta]MCU7966097.1 type IV secretion system DotC family protein [gamma proteobacterium symbiont of Bathyaustriella thionipta]